MNAEHTNEFSDLFPVPTGARSVIVFGGTFDPPHRAHVELSEMVREKIGADWVVYVPAARSPMRDAGPTAPGRDRLAMLRLALAGRARCSVSPIELIADDNAPGSGECADDGGGAAAPSPSYTVDTLRKLRVLAPPAATLRLLIGADQAAVFHKWRQPREIISLAEPVVMLRTPNESIERLMAVIAPNWPPDEAARWRTRVVDVPTMNVNATAIRTALAGSGGANAELEHALNPAVAGYIRSRGLYGSAR